MENLEQSLKKIDLKTLDFETLFKFCPDGIVCKDNKLCYIDANDSYKTTFALTKFESIIGKRNNPYIQENIMKLIQDADNEVVRSCQPINYVINIESDMLLNVTTFPILHNSIFLGLISIIKDITQEEALKTEFVNRHYEYINTERTLQTQRETFVASLGHDLKNPTIAQIRGLELLLKGEFGVINNEQKELLEMILDSCRYMNSMLATLLATYKNADGAIKLNYSDISFEDLVKECISEMIYVAKEKEISIIFEKNVCNQIQADKVQLKRVIMNLLSNGIKYAYKNSALRIRIKSNSQKAEFEFENFSPYIPKEKQQAIFAQYVSYADTHKEIGIGLGLYASKKIIEAHNGKIYVKSFKDEKNIFGFSIPAKKTL